MNRNNTFKRDKPVVGAKGVTEPEGRAELRLGWLAFSAGKVAEAQGMLYPGMGGARCNGVTAAAVAGMGLPRHWYWIWDILTYGLG